MDLPINLPPYNYSRSTGMGALGTVQTLVFKQQSLIGVLNFCIALMMAKLLQAGAKHLSTTQEL
ncbi:hypothetical protein K443DRAFT_7713 [Laccaria amethystina LaAM-08-1]|uniref:Uncharacterized protein n=1 Tax=Laccaria amethystina LaAM-08-1 TaxID=1095629 RepID=A0A0C9WQ84_9AGAR|nr:hypothetical protein K443DRAFT_7713 [Laccaria amethystina LaAM-08-1]